MDVLSLPEILKFAAALLFVLALMGGLALIMRKFGGNHPLTAPHKRRMKVIEVLNLDARRKAVLMKCDDKEHLVILGANGETVVESGIESQQDADIVPLTVKEKNEA